MQKKRILILGAGISGLTTAWYLSRTGVPIEITILEKNSRAGGWLHTDHTTGFHFEKGPRTFKVDKSPAIMRLIAELGLQDEVIWSSSKPHHRYLWFEGELHRFPTNPFSFCLSPITKGFIRALLTEWKQPLKRGDETVWEFVSRRFNYDVARLFFDPMVVGIFGGDIRQISIRACFPKLKSWEETYGSVTKGFWKQREEKKRLSKYSQDVTGVPLTAVYSFRGGVEQLIQSLVNQICAKIHYNQEVTHIEFKDREVIATTESGQITADYLFCALPVKETGQLLERHTPEIAKEFLKVPSLGTVIINFGYDHPVLPVQGFGYLTPTYANEDILGVLFDSSIFTQHNRRSCETRLTIKLRETDRSEEAYIDVAMRGIRRHLGISHVPQAISFKRAPRCIPQYGVGHLEKMDEFKNRFNDLFPHCYLIGNYLNGVSVDCCIGSAKQAVEAWQKQVVRNM